MTPNYYCANENSNTIENSKVYSDISNVHSDIGIPLTTPLKSKPKPTELMQTFIESAKAYLKKEQPLPWCVTNAIKTREQINLPVTFTFSDSLLEELIENPSDFKKDICTAIQYGFRGNTNGGVNGIVRLRNEDEKMRRIISTYYNKNKTILQTSYRIINPEGIKIVVHRPNGLRTIGLMDKHTRHTLFIERTYY